jgi:hypothetical protein
MEEKRTTKTVEFTLTATFYGRYIDADEAFGALQSWIDQGLEDRDDLRSWDFGLAEVREVEGAPDGCDS